MFANSPSTSTSYPTHNQDHTPSSRSKPTSPPHSAQHVYRFQAKPQLLQYVPLLRYSSEKYLPVSTVSGANRGIGYELVLALLKRQPEAVIFAGARDPAKANELNDLASKNPNVHVVQLVADDEESNKKAVEEIKKVTDRLDVVVANAGTLTCLTVAYRADHPSSQVSQAVYSLRIRSMPPPTASNSKSTLSDHSSCTRPPTPCSLKRERRMRICPHRNSM